MILSLLRLNGCLKIQFIIGILIFKLNILINLYALNPKVDLLLSYLIGSFTSFNFKDNSLIILPPFSLA